MNAYLGPNLVSLNPYMNTSFLHRRDFLRVAAKSAIGVAAGREVSDWSGRCEHTLCFRPKEHGNFRGTTKHRYVCHGRPE